MEKEEREGGQNGTKRENATYGGFRAKLISYSSWSSFFFQSHSDHQPTPSELNLFPIRNRTHRESTEFGSCWQLSSLGNM